MVGIDCVSLAKLLKKEERIAIIINNKIKIIILQYNNETHHTTIQKRLHDTSDEQQTSNIGSYQGSIVVKIKRERIGRAKIKLELEGKGASQKKG